MLKPVTTKKFEKDVERARKRKKKIEKLTEIMHLLIQEKKLPMRCHDHWLSGDYENHRECHIEPDWLLIYKIKREEKKIVFERTGSHSDLF